MNAGKITRADLAAAVQSRMGLSFSDSSRLVEDVLSTVSHALERGEAVKLRAFGSFRTHRRSPCAISNPRTGTQVSVPERRVVVFRASPNLRDHINEDSE